MTQEAGPRSSFRSITAPDDIPDKKIQEGFGHPSIGQTNTSLPGSFHSSLAYRSVLSMWQRSHIFTAMSSEGLPISVMISFAYPTASESISFGTCVDWLLSVGMNTSKCSLPLFAYVL